MVTCELGSTLRHQRGPAEPLWELEPAAGPQYSAPCRQGNRLATLPRGGYGS